MSTVPKSRPVQLAWERIETAISALSTINAEIDTQRVGILPVPAAETMMEDAEDLLDQLRTRLRGASAILGAELERLECAEAA